MNDRFNFTFPLIESINLKYRYIVITHNMEIEILQFNNNNSVWKLNNIFTINNINAIRDQFNDNNWALLQKEIFKAV